MAVRGEDQQLRPARPRDGVGRLRGCRFGWFVESFGGFLIFILLLGSGDGGLSGVLELQAGLVIFVHCVGSGYGVLSGDGKLQAG